MIDKKELKKQYKRTLPPMGIYQVKNLVNGKIFIGKSKNVRGKINGSKFQLEQNTHVNKLLQEDYINYGADNFSFEIIDYLEPKDELNYDYSEDLNTLEEMWLEKLQPYGEKGYNKEKTVRCKT